jgi:hypothetical protein
MEQLEQHFATIERVGGKAKADEYRRALENGHIEELLKRMENDLAKMPEVERGGSWYIEESPWKAQVLRK